MGVGVGVGVMTVPMPVGRTRGEISRRRAFTDLLGSIGIWGGVWTGRDLDLDLE